MNLEDQLKMAIREVREAFPFDDYISISHFYEMYSILNELKKFLPEFSGKRLLDIGSGPMDKTGIFKILGFECFAIDDLSDPWHQRDDNIKKIERYAKKLGIQFFQQKFNINHHPFELNSFDVVCSNSVIEHLHESPRELLNLMGTFAKPCGILVIAMPNSVSLKKRIDMLLGKSNYPPVDAFFTSVGIWRGHVREFTLKEAVYICKEAGYEILSAKTFEYQAYEKLPFIARQIYILLGNLVKGFRSNLMVVCKKPENWKIVEKDLESYRRALSRSIPKGVA